MDAERGWRPLQPPRRAGGEAFVISPFTRLARTHAVVVAGDALVAMALAGSLFFSIDPGAARWRVGLYLALTVAPFAVVAPLIGPAIDRAHGGRRWMVIGSSALRALVSVAMVRDLHNLLFFPEAFVMLVLSKTYQVTRSALVPMTVADDAGLVEANAKLSLLSGIVGFVAAAPGIAALRFGDARWTLGLAGTCFVVATVVAWSLPRDQVAPEPTSGAERAELRGAGIMLAASAMGLLRGIVGFLTFLLAFDLRSGGAPKWHFGAVLAVSVAGSLAGALVAPALRRSAAEERILVAVLAGVVAGSLLALYRGGLFGAVVIAGVVGVGASAGKLAFDSLVQRDAPDANRGRSFARFETRFQLTWVAGAVLPVAIHIPARAGAAIVAGVAGFALFSYVAGTRAAGAAAARHRPEVA